MNPNRPKNNKVIQSGGKQPSGGAGGGTSAPVSPGSGQPPKPSPWLDPEHPPNPEISASFVEYLRWMRSYDSGSRDGSRDGTKLELLQRAQRGDYRQRLQRLNARTKRLAGAENTFIVSCPWRIRIGGHRGPESLLLTAFDAIGTPYIPSSTLRGIARTQAIREHMNHDQLSWNQGEKQIGAFFGDLDAASPVDRIGKVVFLDAYPQPAPARPTGGLSLDMANNIWKWEDSKPEYKPNPSPLFSLLEATFVIGLKPMPGCDPQTYKKVRRWLIEGLSRGAGSQVNTGYGVLQIAQNQEKDPSEFFRVGFILQGQLIHGRQDFLDWIWKDQRGEWQQQTKAFAEVRPTAFKSMLRYWFRTFALGFLDADQVKIWEATIFGGINPKRLGWLRCQILDGKVVQKEPRSGRDGRNDPCGEQEGLLVLHCTSEVPTDKKSALEQLTKNLTWLMFHLGGVGQGARRPRYSRQSRDYAPWWRGSTLEPDCAEGDEFWGLPESVLEFQQRIQSHLGELFQSLQSLCGTPIDVKNPRAAMEPKMNDWMDAVDAHCRIVVCAGNSEKGKIHALAKLHVPELKKPSKNSQLEYDGNLCGKMGHDVRPSPVWISDIDDHSGIAYQVVTVFGATQPPRATYLDLLRKSSGPESYAQIWPMK